ncbi:MAG: hypothetical protein DMG07_27055, partial [Acidobacteria bacterium]
MWICGERQSREADADFERASPRSYAHATLGVTVAVNAALAAGAWAAREKGGWKAAAAVSALLVAAAFFGLRPWPVVELTAGAYKYAPYWPAELDPAILLNRGKLLYFREGSHGAVAVRESAGRRLLQIQGKIDATDSGDMATQLM